MTTNKEYPVSTIAATEITITRPFTVGFLSTFVSCVSRCRKWRFIALLAKLSVSKNA